MTRKQRQRFITVAIDLRSDALRLSRREHTNARAAQIATLKHAALVYDQLASEAEAAE